jgi:23S rRNA pseudouridine1911/1915/1917 synthase
LDLAILYEDNHLIAVNKPAGVLSQGDKTGDIVLADIVKEYSRQKIQQAGRSVSGRHPPTRPTRKWCSAFSENEQGASAHE